MPLSINVDATFIASNSLDFNIEDDEEPYGITRFVDSLISVSIHCLKSHNGGRVCNKNISY